MDQLVGLNDLRFYTDNAGVTARMYIDGTGNVGIGTTTPLGKLHIAGAHANGVLVDGNDRPSVAMTGHYPQTVMMAGGSGNASHGSTIMLGSYDAGTSGAHKHWSIGTAGNGSTFLDIGYSSTDINPHAGIRNYAGSTFMTILNSGNVGIGTIAPTFKLHVPSGYIGTDYINTTDNSVASGVTGIMIKAGDNYLRTGTAAAINAFLGTATPAWSAVTSKPAAWLDGPNLIADLPNFNNSVPSGFYQSSGATNAPGGSWYNLINVRHSNTGNDHGFQIAASYYDENIWTRTYQGGTGANNGSYTTWRSLVHSGNVVSQVTAAGFIPNNGSGDWQIASNSNATGYSQASLELRETNFAGAGQQPPRLGFHWGGVVASQIGIEASGRIAILNNPGNAYEQLIASNVYANDYYLNCWGWLSPYFCSDLRYKKDIVPMQNVLPDVLKLQGVKYNWREDEFPDKHFDDRREIGIIAQEVEKIFPEIVNIDKDGFRSVDYGKLTPVLIEAIKELNAKNEAQQKINEAQQKMLEEMKKEIEILKKK